MQTPTKYPERALRYLSRTSSCGVHASPVGYLDPWTGVVRGSGGLKEPGTADYYIDHFMLQYKLREVVE